jgi:phage terminase large subunit
MCAVDLKLAIRPNKPKIGAFDVAGGGVDKNAYPLRQDSTIKKIIQWNDSDSVSATHEVVRLGTEDGIETLYLDPIGVGDGAVGTLRQNPPPFEWFGVDSRHRPSDDFFEEEEKLCSDKFINKRAELWWKMRRRFERTYEYVHKGVQHPHSEMISIPNDPQLITELSSPLFFYRDSGKLKIESKEDMRRRGVASPNMADAVVMCFADEYSDFLDWL